MLVHSISNVILCHDFLGLASIDSKKKAKLQVLLDNILHLPEVYAKEESDGQWRLHEGIKAAMRYIENAQNDIMVMMSFLFFLNFFYMLCLPIRIQNIVPFSRPIRSTKRKLQLMNQQRNY